MAYFMPSSSVTYETEVEYVKDLKPDKKSEVVRPIFEKEAAAIENNNINVAEIVDDVGVFANKKVESPKTTTKLNIQNTPTTVSDENTKINVKKKRNRNPIFNDGVKIGIVFLVIAIGLAFIPLTQLSILFGVVSAIFFVLGLKKYMRKNRFRNIFKR
jgi:hypothetical protein